MLNVIMAEWIVSDERVSCTILLVGTNSGSSETSYSQMYSQEYSQEYLQEYSLEYSQEYSLTGELADSQE